MENSKETKVCKHCQTEIPKKAKVCPQCRKKQGGIGKWFIILGVVLFLIGFLGSLGEDNSNIGNNQNQSNNSEKETEIEITYTQCTVDEMVKLLEENALKAEKEYQDKYVEVTGRLSNIDSDGSYISLSCVNDEWSFTTVQCYIQNDEQLDKVMEMATGDTVTLKGKVTSIGEVLGYSLDIDIIN